jgi:signal peptidase I
MMNTPDDASTQASDASRTDAATQAEGGAHAGGSAPAGRSAPGEDAPADGGARGEGPAGEGPAGEGTAGEGPAGEGTAGEGPAGEGTGHAKAEAQGKGGKRGKSRKFYRELAIIVAAAVILTLLLKAFVVQVYRIPSDSMDNTLLPGDRVLVNKLIYHFRGIARGDIVVFSGAGSWGNLDGTPVSPPPSNPAVRFFDAVLADIGVHNNNTYYIKRVIGLPGDRVACCTNGLVTVNGVPLHETGYLYPGAIPSRMTFSVTVPPGHLWVMGDNRQYSDDSRSHMVDGSPDQGTVPENEVTGRAFLVIWPLSRFGDLPIPATFKQTTLNAAPAGAIAMAIGAPVLIWRRRTGKRS